jgi:hypothetical protein
MLTYSKLFLHPGNPIKLPFDFKCMEEWDPKVPDRIVEDTTAIAGALKDFGGFPERYYVRLEEVLVFQNFLEIFHT